MGKLIAIRHGQSTWNAENRFTGWVDVDLSEKGVQEAEKSGKLVKELNIASPEVDEKTAQECENYSTDMAELHLKAIRSVLDTEDPSYKQ